MLHALWTFKGAQGKLVVMVQCTTCKYKVSFRQFVCLTSMSLSKFLNCSMLERALIPPQLWLERKSTGLTTLGTAGNRSKKSNSDGSICLFISKIQRKKKIGNYIIISVQPLQSELKAYCERIFCVEPVSTSKLLAPPHTHIKVKPAAVMERSPILLKYVGDQNMVLPGR